jgi:tripartite-type tricarboxylate transporter receptor subunit TctC
MRAVVSLFALLLSSACWSQAFPSKPITMVVGFEPGGGTDTVARVVAKFLGDNIGQQVLVENRAGAGGNIAVDYVIKSAPDGYTIVLGNVGALTVNPHLMKLAYDPLRDLAPVTMAVVFPNIIVTNPSRMPAKTLAEFIKIAKEKPNTVTFGSSGVGGAGHLAGALLEDMAHVELVHVPYKGGGPAMSDLLGGQIPSLFASAPTAVGPVKTGRIRAIATTGPKRSASFPDVPTIAESGYPGYEATNWYGLVAPAKTPKDIIERLNRDFVKTLNAPSVREQLLSHGEEPTPTTPEEFGRFMQREYETWGKVVKEANIHAE